MNSQQPDICTIKTNGHFFHNKQQEQAYCCMTAEHFILTVHMLDAVPYDMIWYWTDLHWKTDSEAASL